MQSTTVANLFAQASEHHQKGNFDKAEVLYNRILALDNNHISTLNNLGTLLLQRGNVEEGIQMIEGSLEIDPNQPSAHNNRSNALQDLKRLDEALAGYDRAIALKPDFTDAYNNRGNALRALDRMDEALISYDRAIALKPDYSNAYNNRGIALRALGRLEEALVSYDRAIALKPDFTDAYNNRGNALRALGRLEEALISYDRAIALKPDYSNAYNNRGIALRALGRLEEALASCDRAIALKPDYSNAYNNRGIALQELRRLDEALASCDRAIALEPDFVDAYNNRGNALQALKRLDEALDSYDQAIALKPDFVDVYNNRGNALQALKRLDEALDSYDQAIALKPDCADAYNNRGVALQELKRMDEALTSYESAIALKSKYSGAYFNQGTALTILGRFNEARASYAKTVSIESDYPYAIGQWLHCKLHCCDWEDLDITYEKIANAIDLDKKVLSPFISLASPFTLSQKQQCAQTYIADKFPNQSTMSWQSEPYAHDRVRIGYFSSDFRNHPITFLMAELIEQHDRSRFEINGFSFGPNRKKDDWHLRMEKAFDRFSEVGTLSDREIAKLVRDMEIDIAVDLNGHTLYARTGIFALRPAPIQLSYLGFIGTMGADYIDYIIGDKVVIPEEHRKYYDEKIIYLPNSYQVNNSTKEISDKRFSRVELGLPDAAFVFCCFNNNYKITPDLFNIWMNLLTLVSGSVLWLIEGNATVAKNLHLEAEKRGVSSDRLVFAPRMELADYLARYRSADLFLDTFYYNAGTTASDALWAGLPVLTCLGETFAGRMAASLLNAIGLPELVAQSHEEYESLALEMATQPDRLVAIREKLAANRSTHPLFNTASFRYNLEGAYIKIYERCTAGLPPDHIII